METKEREQTFDEWFNSLSEEEQREYYEDDYADRALMAMEY
jgi:hypothetical protein